MKPTVENLTVAILDASSRLNDSENTRYPFNCANAAITCTSAGDVYCGTNLNPDPDDIILMDEEFMCSEITENMTEADAQSLAERIIADLD